MSQQGNMPLFWVFYEILSDFWMLFRPIPRFLGVIFSEILLSFLEIIWTFWNWFWTLINDIEKWCLQRLFFISCSQILSLLNSLRVALSVSIRTDERVYALRVKRLLPNVKSVRNFWNVIYAKLFVVLCNDSNILNHLFFLTFTNFVNHVWRQAKQSSRNTDRWASFVTICHYVWKITIH